MTQIQHTYNRVRIDGDALGNVEVTAEHLRGARTQRSHLNFPSSRPPLFPAFYSVCTQIIASKVRPTLRVSPRISESA
jgi:fumarate hydratase class II